MNYLNSGTDQLAIFEGQQHNGMSEDHQIYPDIKMFLLERASRGGSSSSHNQASLKSISQSVWRKRTVLRKIDADELLAIYLKKRNQNPAFKTLQVKEVDGLPTWTIKKSGSNEYAVLNQVLKAFLYFANNPNEWK